MFSEKLRVFWVHSFIGRADQLECLVHLSGPLQREAGHQLELHDGWILTRDREELFRHVQKIAGLQEVRGGIVEEHRGVGLLVKSVEIGVCRTPGIALLIRHLQKETPGKAAQGLSFFDLFV